MKNPKWCVKKVEPTKNYELILTFEYGERKIMNMKPLLEDPENEPLRNQSFFLKAHIVGDSVGWNEDIDIAPEFLYEKSVAFD